MTDRSDSVTPADARARLVEKLVDIQREMAGFARNLHMGVLKARRRLVVEHVSEWAERLEAIALLAAPEEADASAIRGEIERLREKWTGYMNESARAGEPEAARAFAYAVCIMDVEKLLTPEDQP